MDKIAIHGACTGIAAAAPAVFGYIDFSVAFYYLATIWLVGITTPWIFSHGR